MDPLKPDIARHAIDDIENLQTQLATVCDFMNIWARESGVEECHDPYSHHNLRSLADRLWTRSNGKIHYLRGEVDKRREDVNEALLGPRG